MENDKKSQLDRANQALVEIAPHITSSDRQEVKKSYSEFTLVQYLKGRGKNLDTAIDLLQIFRKRIEGREKVLS